MNTVLRLTAGGSIVVVLLASIGCSGSKCGPSFEGEIFLLTTNAEVEAIEKCTTLSGRVEIDGNQGEVDIESLTLPNLESLDQGLLVHNLPNLTAISLPALVSSATDGRFGGSLEVLDNGSLRSVSAPKFELIGPDTDTLGAHGIIIGANPTLETLDLSGLRHVTGGINLKLNPSLTELSLPKLDFLGGDIFILEDGAGAVSLPALEEWAWRLELGDNSTTTTVSAPKAQFAVVFMDGNTGLTDVSLPGVTSAFVSITDSSLSSVDLSGLASASTVEFLNNDNLMSLSLPLLTEVTEGSFSVRDHDSLQSLSAPLLTEVQNAVLIDGNDLLPQCDVDVIMDQVTGSNLSVGCP
jgi:hypothetical protein